MEERQTQISGTLSARMNRSRIDQAAKHGHRRSPSNGRRSHTVTASSQRQLTSDNQLGDGGGRIPDAVIGDAVETAGVTPSQLVHGQVGRQPVRTLHRLGQHVVAGTSPGHRSPDDGVGGGHALEERHASLVGQHHAGDVDDGGGICNVRFKERSR